MANKTYVLLDDVIAHIASCERSDMLPVECSAIMLIKNIPAADVVEVRHGEWIWLEEDEDDFETNIVECSYCGKSYATLFSKESFFETFKFCHNCGTKMDGGKLNDAGRI